MFSENVTADFLFQGVEYSLIYRIPFLTQMMVLLQTNKMAEHFHK